MVCMFQEICKQSVILGSCATFNVVIPGSEIPKWFKHQSVGNIVNAQVTHLKRNVNIQVLFRSSNKWIGMAVCIVFSCPCSYFTNLPDCLRCRILINKHEGSEFWVGICTRLDESKSRHLWMSYFPTQMFNENERTVLNQIYENGFIQMEVRFRWDSNPGLEFKKCGFHLIYEQDIEYIKEMISAQSNNSTCVNPYEGLDACQDFDNSTKGIKMK